ncbi:unnamed protein product [Lampetra planeri]
MAHGDTSGLLAPGANDVSPCAAMAARACGGGRACVALPRVRAARSLWSAERRRCHHEGADDSHETPRRGRPGGTVGVPRESARHRSVASKC